ncbi:unnamed protein product [Ectocarpus sp. CCAP 1310/34]|nr:unnamed protein product [Ectocarpus sp. CCAP 1310/34]
MGGSLQNFLKSVRDARRVFVPKNMLRENIRNPWAWHHARPQTQAVEPTRRECCSSLGCKDVATYTWVVQKKRAQSAAGGRPHFKIMDDLRGAAAGGGCDDSGEDDDGCAVPMYRLRFFSVKEKQILEGNKRERATAIRSNMGATTKTRTSAVLIKTMKISRI